MLEKYLSFGMKYILYKVDCGIIKKSFLDIKKCFDKIMKVSITDFVINPNIEKNLKKIFM